MTPAEKLAEIEAGIIARYPDRTPFVELHQDGRGCTTGVIWEDRASERQRTVFMLNMHDLKYCNVSLVLSDLDYAIRVEQGRELESSVASQYGQPCPDVTL